MRRTALFLFVVIRRRQISSVIRIRIYGDSSVSLCLSVCLCLGCAPSGAMSMQSLAGGGPQGNLTQSGPRFPSILSVAVSRESRTRQPVRGPSPPLPSFLPRDRLRLFAFQQARPKSHHLMSCLLLRKWKRICLPLSSCRPLPHTACPPLSQGAGWDESCVVSLENGK
jgi:hypothetical protein